MTTNEQLKALAEATSNPTTHSVENFVAYIEAVTPERILALIAENEQADKLLQQALEVWDNITGATRTTINAPAAMGSIRTYLEGKNA